MTAKTAFRKIARADGLEIAARVTPGRGPGVVFLPGFRSDMTGDKATTLEEYCRARGQAFLRFDYSGHGLSDGEFADGTIGGWTADAVLVLDQLTDGPQILVGSSMGGWIMLLAALTRRERVAGLLGIAAAPDFTEDLMWASAPAAMREALETKGVFFAPSDYAAEMTPITMKLIEDGRRHLLLGGAINLDCPVRLIHGRLDPDVPWQVSDRLAGALASTDVETVFVKAGDHRLSTPGDLARLTRVLGGLLDDITAATGAAAAK